MARILILFFLFPIFVAHAQTRDLDKLYEKAKFRVGKKQIAAYVADSDSKRADGLMFIEKLPHDTGMLFIFESERPLSFWMKNTLIPLSIGFFDAKGKLVDMQEMTPAESLMARTPPSYQSRAPAVFALEMPSGWFTKNGIKNGSRLELVGKTRSDLLKRQLGGASRR